jgi:hypothetical protein
MQSSALMTARLDQQPRRAISCRSPNVYSLLEVEVIFADDRTVRRGSGCSAFEEGVRWVAPIQASSRLVMEDT